MQELTVVFNAQITMIMKSNKGFNTDSIDENVIAEALKRQLNADDVQVDEIKVFITKEIGDEQINHVE